MNDQIKESTNEVTKDIPISQLDPMLKLRLVERLFNNFQDK